MKFKLTIPFLLYCVLLLSCATKKEVVMPYYNYGYTADRILPVNFSSADFEFRAWINNGTSVDQIISISKDKTYGDKAYFAVIGNLWAKNRSKQFYNQIKITPKSGIDGFIAKVDSLGLANFESQPDSSFAVAFDQPFSLYIVELIKNGKYHSFKFNAPFSAREKGDKKYDTVRNLLYSEFDFSLRKKYK
jgi:hypothetical protein